MVGRQSEGQGGVGRKRVCVWKVMMSEYFLCGKCNEANLFST